MSANVAAVVNYERSNSGPTTLLDLAFIMDCTLSMGAYIANARNSIKTIVEEIVNSEKLDLKLALVEYRDHPPQEHTFVTRVHNFTSSDVEMKMWLDACDAVGGGDLPEAVADGVYEGLNLAWRKGSTKICILVADAPPHGLTRQDTMPNGCACGVDPVKVVHQMATKGIILYCVGCEPAVIPFKNFFEAIAYTTGGKYVPLKNANLLAKVIVGTTQEELSLEKWMPIVQKEVEKYIEESGGHIDESILNTTIHEKLKADGAITKNLQINNENMERACKESISYSKLQTLPEYKKEFKLTPSVKIKPERTISRDRFGPPSLSRESSINSDTLDEKLESFTVDSDLINEFQTERLVQKALHRRLDKNVDEIVKVEPPSEPEPSIEDEINKKMNKIEDGLKYFGELNKQLKSFMAKNTEEFDRMKKIKMLEKKLKEKDDFIVKVNEKQAFFEKTLDEHNKCFEELLENMDDLVNPEKSQLHIVRL